MGRTFSPPSCGPKWFVPSAVFAFLLIFLVPGSDGQSVKSVQCACDLAKGIIEGHGPNFDCRTYCGGLGSGGFSRSSVQQQLLGTVFNSFMQGFMEGTASGPSDQQAEDLRSKQLEEQRQALQQELDQHRQFQEAFRAEQLKTQGLLKGPKPPDLAHLKGMGDSTTPSRENDKHWERVHCSADLADLAEAARKRGDKDEAAYLTEQSMVVLKGGKADVQCPQRPVRSDPLPVMGRETPQDKFYETLLKSTKESLDQLASVSDRIRAIRLQQRDGAKGGRVDPALKEALDQEQAILAEIQRKQALYQEVQKNPQTAEQALARITRH